MKKISVMTIACLLFVCVFAFAGCGDFENKYVTVKFVDVTDNSTVATVVTKVGDAVNIPIVVGDALVYTNAACTQAYDITTVMVESQGGTTLTLYFAPIQ